MIVFQQQKGNLLEYAIPLWAMMVVHIRARQMNLTIWKQKLKNALLSMRWNLYAIMELVGAKRIRIQTPNNMATDQLKVPVTYRTRVTPMEFAEVILNINIRSFVSEWIIRKHHIDKLFM